VWSLNELQEKYRHGGTPAVDADYLAAAIAASEAAAERAAAAKAAAAAAEHEAAAAARKAAAAAREAAAAQADLFAAVSRAEQCSAARASIFVDKAKALKGQLEAECTEAAVQRTTLLVELERQSSELARQRSELVQQRSELAARSLELQSERIAADAAQDNLELMGEHAQMLQTEIDKREAALAEAAAAAAAQRHVMHEVVNQLRTPCRRSATRHRRSYCRCRLGLQRCGRLRTIVN